MNIICILVTARMHTYVVTQICWASTNNTADRVTYQVTWIRVPTSIPLTKGHCPLIESYSRLAVVCDMGPFYLAQSAAIILWVNYHWWFNIWQSTTSYAIINFITCIIQSNTAQNEEVTYWSLYDIGISCIHANQGGCISSCVWSTVIVACS